jgi:hypothetical protein
MASWHQIIGLFFFPTPIYEGGQTWGLRLGFIIFRDFCVCFSFHANNIQSGLYFAACLKHSSLFKVKSCLWKMGRATESLFFLSLSVRAPES